LHQRRARPDPPRASRDLRLKSPPRVRYAILSDIHGNLEALRAVLADCGGAADGVLCLGDTVGYGPDPLACVELVAEKAEAIVSGNHEHAVAGRLDLEWFNRYARAAAEGTRARPMRCGTPRRAAWRSAASCTITRPRAARSWTPACRAFSPTAWRRAPEAGRMPHRLREAALLVGSAVVLALAFPRTDWEMAAWFALVPLLLVALETAPRIAFAWGWLYGLTFFLVLLRWLDFTFRTYSEIPWPLTWGVVFLLSAWCGLYVAAVAGLVSLIARRGSPAWA